MSPTAWLARNRLQGGAGICRLGMARIAAMGLRLFPANELAKLPSVPNYEMPSPQHGTICAAELACGDPPRGGRYYELFSGDRLLAGAIGKRVGVRVSACPALSSGQNQLFGAGSIDTASAALTDTGGVGG